VDSVETDKLQQTVVWATRVLQTSVAVFNLGNAFIYRRPLKISKPRMVS